ncbi:ATP-grasp domain-containing protein [Sinorhizobium medicae]|uniref:ATP-grasp domain-containing protein n=1 Tax=Sinorhizobium medicae TaxID=110321 RepID=UPI00129780F8|nr:acetyl-CoA carboxylase biotin carboxylase subunit family protein [Sinorhizobium medicae]MQX98052.1 ATP-grasp domain-containing protein [Sinorhizobium medicae]MQX98691.1 ATP-grasp domain-containing protein [Sinorhizobium medicae]MQX98693.1 ATP-grasp domain-containing protein [Sinorhizobium medicae]MQX98739.1 ATP-grasp domain-containing protein [Sinorhizobium medicae]
MATKVLILVEGGIRGLGQLYVQAAKCLGLHPIVLSADPAQYGYLATENIEAVSVDTGNLDALVRECSRIGATYDIAGITSARETSYAIAGKLCQHFGLPGPNPASIERCCDKFTQRRLLAGAGIPIPDYRLATNAAEVEIAAAEIGLPVILKPVAGSGSRGVRLCRTFEEVAEHTTYLLGGTHVSSPRILVEEFAQGPYYTADTMGNEVIAIGAGDFGPPPHFVYREYTFPAALTDDEHKRIAEISLSCLRALDLGWGPANIELRWTESGPIVIEVNPRLGGTPDPQLIQLAHGVDLVRQHIKLVIGGKWDLRRRHSQTASVRFLLPDYDGTLDWIDGDTQASDVPGVVDVKWYVEPKTPIVRKGDYQEILGHVIAASPSLVQNEAALDRAVDLIRWSITPSPTLGEQQQSVATHLPPLRRVVSGKK